jgi:hypothetical protein
LAGRGFPLKKVTKKPALIPEFRLTFEFDIHIKEILIPQPGHTLAVSVLRLGG